MGEDKKGIVPDLKVKRYDMETDSVLAEGKVDHVVRNASELDELTVMEDSVNGLDKQAEDSLNPFSSPVNGKLFYEKERDFYTDKSVIDCELPELLVCFKEGTYHVVKDICIDDGLPSLDKIYVENGEVRDKFNLQRYGVDVNRDLTMEKGNAATSISNWRNPFVEYDGETDVAKQFDSGRCIPNGEGDFHESADDDSDDEDYPETWDWGQELDVGTSLDDVEKVMPVNLDLTQGLEVGKSLQGVSDEKAETLHLEEGSDVDKSVDDVLDEKALPQNIHVEEELDIGKLPESSNLNEDKDQQQSTEDDTNSTSKETSSVTSTLSTAEELDKCNQATKAPFSSKSENGSITYDFDSSPPATTGKEEDSKDTDILPTVQPPNILATEEGSVDSRTTSSRSFYIQHGHGESSFSAMGPLSGPISYSGLIPYSGSISLRSDSSTTSTRSFAFPVLNTEWNASPVKMAKADRRKHRGWRMSFLCCRF